MSAIEQSAVEYIREVRSRASELLSAPEVKKQAAKDAGKFVREHVRGAAGVAKLKGTEALVQLGVAGSDSVEDSDHAPIQ